MADLTKSLKLKAQDFGEQNPIRYEMKRISLADLTAGGTDNIFDIAAEKAVVSCALISRVTAAGGTSIAVSFNSADLIGAAVGVTANLAKGDVIAGDFTGSNAFYVVAADTVDITTVGTFTAGEIDLIIGYVSVLDNT
jgi:hypothetical protein